MSSLFRGVRGGTSCGESLCDSCQAFVHMKGAGESQERLGCKALDATPRLIPFKMFECTLYKDKRLISIYDMEQRAYFITAQGQILKSNEYFSERIREELARKGDKVPPADYGFLTKRNL